MDSAAVQPVAIEIGEGGQVSGLLQTPSPGSDPRACFVFAHGAGAGMTHPYMAAIAGGLAKRGIAVLRYQFLYMERGSKRTDSPAIAHAVVRAAVMRAAQLLPRVPLFAGGKSFGGRMTSQAQAIESLPAVQGLAFLGFPLHPPDKPSVDRAEHLFKVRIPMLFMQGTRDEFAQLDLLEPLIDRLPDFAELKLFPEADHSFHVPARTGRTDSQVRDELLDAMAAWMDKVLS